MDLQASYDWMDPTVTVLRVHEQEILDALATRFADLRREHFVVTLFVLEVVKQDTLRGYTSAFLAALSAQLHQAGCYLVFDEIMTGLRVGGLFAWEYLRVRDYESGAGPGAGIKPDFVSFGKVFRFAGIVSVSEQCGFPLTIRYQVKGNVTESTPAQVMYTSTCLLEYTYREQVFKQWRAVEHHIQGLWENAWATLESETVLGQKRTRSQSKNKSTRKTATVRGIGAIWYCEGPKGRFRYLFDIFVPPTNAAADGTDVELAQALETIVKGDWASVLVLENED
jgi:hypothetical protein